MRGGANRWLRAAAVLPALATGTAARAGDKVLFQPVPAWVKAAPPITAVTDGPPIVRLDTQERMADGGVWTYRDVATRMASTEIVAQAGTIQLPWQPAKGDLIVHRVEILRGGRVIDVLAGGKTFTVIRREQQLEQRSIDGQLTATLPVEGLQVGDVLRLAVSITRRDAALGGQVQNLTLLPAEPAPIGYARTRMLWPAALPIRWRALSEGAKPVVSTANGETELVVAGLLPKPADLPNDAPVAWRPLPLLEASSFADWAAVSRVMAPYYAPKPLGAELAAEVARIKAASPDPLRRADAALQLVQDKVRYLFNGMDDGNYVPQAADSTWTLRYGDCKAKTALLMALLAAMDVPAEAVLVNTELGGLAPRRLPSAAAFNHVLVRATIGDRAYWLDGTGSGARFADMGDVPPFRWALPIRAGGAELIAVPSAAPARPTTAVVLDVDQSAGVLLPAVVTMKLTVRGPAAAQVGMVKAQGGREGLDAMVSQLATKAIGGDAAVTRYAVAHDPLAAVATIDATATVTNFWQRVDDRWRMPLDRTVSDLNFEPDRSRPAWKDIPVATGAPDAVAYTVRVRLPDGGRGYVLEGDRTVDGAIGSATLRRSVIDRAGLIGTEDVLATSGADVAPADVAGARAKLAAAKERLLRVAAPAELAPRWAMVRDARARGLLKPILAAYSDAVAAHPDDVDALTNRANFLTGVYDWKGALPDLDRAIAKQPSAELLNARAFALRNLGQDDRAMADLRASLALEPADQYALGTLADLLAARGDRAGALKLLDERAASGGDKQRGWALGRRAAVLARLGDKQGAVAALDQAVAARPNNPGLLNERCWIKAQLALQLDTALKDCTKAIELSDSTTAALDSRALVYFRLDRPDDALADLDAALAQEPGQSGSLYLRGIIRARQGQADASRRDLEAARLIDPNVAESYAPYGIAP